jgi:hypothetical protein
MQDGRNLHIGGDISSGLGEIGIGDATIKIAASKFESAFASLTDILHMVEKSVGQAKKKPSKVELEFGFSLTSDCSIWIVSGGGKAEFKVKVSWD